VIRRVATLAVSVNSLLMLSNVVILSEVGLSTWASLLLASSLTLLCNILSRYNVFIKNLRLSSRLRKANVINLGNLYVIQGLTLHNKLKVPLELNLGGAALPLALALTASLHILLNHGIQYLIPLLALSITSAFLVNKVSILIRGVGMAVPIIITSSLVSVVMVAASLLTNLPKSTTLLCTYILSVISILVGVDIVNLSRVALYNIRKVIIGGLGIYDAINIIPALSVLITYVITSATNP